MEKNAGAGYVTKHDSLEALAEHYKIPLDALKATVEEYNAMAEKGEDTVFRADFSKTKNNRVDKPPYYAVMVKPNLTYSLAGALITPKAEVVGVLDGRAHSRPLRGGRGCLWRPRGHASRRLRHSRLLRVRHDRRAQRHGEKGVAGWGRRQKAWGGLL